MSLQLAGARLGSSLMMTAAYLPKEMVGRGDLGPVVGCTVVGEDSRPVKRQRRADLSGLDETYATGKSLLHTC